MARPRKPRVVAPENQCSESQNTIGCPETLPNETMSEESDALNMTMTPDKPMAIRTPKPALDRSKSFGTVHGSKSHGAVYEQDSRLFNSKGELVEED